MFYLPFRPLFFLALTSLSLFASCSKHTLSVRTDYVSADTLASSYIGTPDPRQCHPPIGQRLLVFWTLPSKLLDQNPELRIRIRFRQNEETSQTVPIIKKKGWFIFSTLNDDFIRTKGILTYKVELVLDGEIVEEARQLLWTELIRLGEGEKNELGCKVHVDQENLEGIDLDNIDLEDESELKQCR